jgi:hypothetical protein
VHDAPQTPLTEEEIRASTVGELTPHAATIQLAAYDPTWPLLFRRYADAKSEIVRQILARELAAGRDDEVAGASAERAL